MTLPLRLYDKADTTARPLLAVVQAEYHLGEVLTLRKALSELGYNLVIAVPKPRHDVLSPLRAGTKRSKQVHKMLNAEGFKITDDFCTSLDRFAGLVVLNDWGLLRNLVLEAKSVGVPTFGIVEGVQDFADADIDRNRDAYRTVDIALCKGQDDFDALDGTNREIVGSNRLQTMLQGPLSSDGQAAIANCNFSYGVLSSSRRPWLKSVQDGCSTAGVSYRISKHPGDHGWVNPLKVTRTPIAQLVRQGDTLISRFSTVILEALAVGTRVIYHNPHRELVPTFHDPKDAYTVTTSATELAQALQPDGLTPAQRRELASDFLGHNLSISETSIPAQRAAQLISRTIALAG